MTYNVLMVMLNPSHSLTLLYMWRWCAVGWSPWGKQVRGTWSSVWPLLSHFLLACLILGLLWCFRLYVVFVFSLLLLFWFRCQYSSSDLLESRKVESRRLSPQRPGGRVSCVVCIMICCLPCRFLLAWHRVSLNTNQPYTNTCC